MTEDKMLGRRLGDHIEPCGLLQVVQSEVVNIKEDVGILYKRVDRLPNWMVMLWGVTMATLGGSFTAVIFLAGKLVGKF
ncbi:MAG: hypothetical protein U1E29_18320 [Coriobacteriia bacterium]|nr:hypothetical protein [Coriobacteriia bacterium]